MRARRVHLVASGLLALTLTFGACNGDGNDQARNSTTTEATTTSSTTTTTTAPTATTQPVAGPEPWAGIASDIWQRLAALSENPDPSGVAAVIAESCDCYQRLVDSMQTLASSGQHFEGDQARPVALKLVGSTDLQGSQRLTVRVESGRYRRVDANGALIEELGPIQSTCVSVLVAPSGAGGVYRLHDFVQVQQCPEGL